MGTGWVIVKRRNFDDRQRAAEWVKRSAGALARKHSSRQIRGSVVEAGTWLNLEWVLADYEAKRKAGDPEFNERGSWVASPARTAATYTPRQGQFLAFIHSYTILNKRPPAEADMQQYFRVTPPSVHQMVLTLERRGLIERTPGAARSIRVLVPRDQLPELG
jgi:hypothetical protein